jgi:hypothetical protein
MIQRRSTDHAGLHPEAAAKLHALSAVESRHVEFDLRPPLAAYCGSLQDVVFAFQAAINAIDDVRRTAPWSSHDEHWDRRYVLAVENLLYCMVEHIDTCTGALSCFFPGDFRKHPVYKQWDKDVRLYRSRVATIVNAVKHNQRRMRGIVMYDQTESVPGYYVEKIGSDSDGNEMAHADPLIHPKGNTAISTHRDLRLHLAQLFQIGRYLSNALSGLATSETRPPDRKGADEQLFEIVRRVSGLPTYFFFDEVNQPVPAVGAGEDSSGVRTIWTEYPSSRIRPTSLAEPRFSISFTGDARIMKVPYAAVGVARTDVSRNDPCPCGSGAKFKKCHGRIIDF